MSRRCTARNFLSQFCFHGKPELHERQMFHFILFQYKDNKPTVRLSNSCCIYIRCKYSDKFRLINWPLSGCLQEEKRINFLSAVDIVSEQLYLIRVISNINCTDRHKNMTIMILRSQMWLYIVGLLHVISGSLIIYVINLSVVKL